MKKICILISVLLIGCSTRNATFNIVITETSPNQYLLNNRFDIYADIVGNNNQNRIHDEHIVRTIASELNDNIDYYGDWYSYYYVPVQKCSGYKLILRTDDSSTREYMLLYDNFGKITNSYIVAETFGDGSDFRDINSVYERGLLTRHIVAGHYVLNNIQDSIVDTLPPVADTIVEEIIVRSKL